MSDDKRALVSLNLLNSLRKRDKMQASLAFYLFSPTRLIKSIKHELSCKIFHITRYISSNHQLEDFISKIQHLTLCILETHKQVLWQTVKTKMKCGIISSGSALFAKIKQS